jgi:uncharacterized membrane protein
MEAKDFLDWWPVAVVALSALSTVAAYSIKHGLASKEDLAAHGEDEQKRFRLVEDRLARVESELKHAPTHEDLAHIRTDLSALKAHMAGQAEATRGLQDTLQRFERPLNLVLEHHLAGSKR